MSAPLTEFVIETVLRDGLGDLRANPSQVDDIFGKFLEAQFLNQYGQSKIDSIKTYIANNQIKIVHAWQQVPTTVPCFSIQLVRASEEEDIQQLGMEYEDLDSTKEPTVFAPTVTPGTYDTLTGKLTITNSVDLSAVCPGMVFKDSAGTTFDIQAPISNLSGNKYITIGKGMEPELTQSGLIQSSIDFTRTERRMIRLRETILLGVHAKNDIHLAKFLYYILVYIIKSRQQSMITRGIHLDRGTGQVFDRLDEFEGENIFSRMLEINCMTEFVWNQGTAQIFDCFDLTVKTPTPKPDSKDAEPYNKSE